MATRDAGYTQTGNGWLTSLANKLSFIPFMGVVSGVLIAVDTALSSVGWLLRGKPMSALAVAGSGAAGAVSAATMSINPVWYMTNLVSGITTGRSINTHMRKLTEGTESFITKPLGIQPTVLRANFAGIGGIAGAMPSAPGRFTTQIANERGQNAQEMYANYMRGEGGAHVNELGSAMGRGA